MRVQAKYLHRSGTQDGAGSRRHSSRYFFRSRNRRGPISGIAKNSDSLVETVSRRPRWGTIAEA
jgi:hypothetical protein